MSRLILTATSSALIIALAPVGAPGAQKGEGMYGGKSFTEWVKLLDSPDAETRADAYSAWGKMADSERAARGGAAYKPNQPLLDRMKEALPGLLTGLRDKTDENRWLAAVALGSVGELLGEGKTVVPALVAALADKTATVRSKACHALGTFGSAAKDAVPALKKIQSEDPDSDVRKRAGVALGIIESK